MAIPEHDASNQYFDDGVGEDLANKTRAPLDEMPTSTFTSSNVHSALYDFGERTMWIRFLRTAGADAIYRYDDVPATQWNDLVEASSKGSLVNAEIAYDYRYTKVNRPDVTQNTDRGEVTHRIARRFLFTP